MWSYQNERPKDMETSQEKTLRRWRCNVLKSDKKVQVNSTHQASQQHVLEKSTVFNCTGLQLKKSARVFVLLPSSFGVQFENKRCLFLSLSLSLRRGVGRSNILVRLTITAFLVCFIFYRYLNHNFDEDRIQTKVFLPL